MDVSQICYRDRTESVVIGNVTIVCVRTRVRERESVLLHLRLCCAVFNPATCPDLFFLEIYILLLVLLQSSLILCICCLPCYTSTTWPYFLGINFNSFQEHHMSWMYTQNVHSYTERLARPWPLTVPHISWYLWSWYVTAITSRISSLASTI